MIGRLYTIGYEGSSQERVVAALRKNEVSLLVDVRERSVSRKAGMSKRSLTEALAAAGIAYEHWREFGTPKPIRDLLKAQHDWDAYRRAYEERLDERSWLLGDLAMRLEREQGCLLCFERDATRCHRSLLARRLEESGLLGEVVHLVADG